MTLNEIVNEIAADPSEPLRELDISEVMGKPVGTVVLKYRVPDIPTLFQRNEDAEIIRQQNPLLPRTLCSTIALMALSHAYPPPSPGSTTGVLYQSFCKNRKLWVRLESGFLALMPELYATDSIENAKNGSGATGENCEPSPCA